MAEVDRIFADCHAILVRVDATGFKELTAGARVARLIGRN
jgi:hypothetical protein